MTLKINLYHIVINGSDLLCDSFAHFQGKFLQPCKIYKQSLDCWNSPACLPWINYGFTKICHQLRPILDSLGTVLKNEHNLYLQRTGSQGRRLTMTLLRAWLSGALAPQGQSKLIHPLPLNSLETQYWIISICVFIITHHSTPKFLLVFSPIIYSHQPKYTSLLALTSLPFDFYSH